jgi:hypothetical protein
MKYKLRLLFPVLLFSVVCNCQESKAKDYLADFDLFRSIFEQANAGLYKYHSRTAIDSAFSSGRKQISTSISYRDFFNIVWNVIDFTGSSHNSLDYPDTLKNQVFKKQVFFPLPLKYLNHKLYANLAYKTIPLGSEILSVNGMNANDFAKDISRYLSTDGKNISGKYAFLETNWLPFYVYLAYGEQVSFVVRYRNDSTTAQTTLDAVDYKTFIENYKQRFVPRYEESDRDYTFAYTGNGKTGVLTVNTFALGGPKKPSHKKYAAFLDSVFIDLRSRHIKDLIVDVRQNGGGDDPNDLLLYSYLTRRNFRENTSAFTIFNKVALKEYFIEEDTGEIAELEEELKDEHNQLIKGRFYQHPKFNKTWHPNKNAFTGKVLLLISPFVASAGSLFASMVKSDQHSVVIGQETLGGYYGHTGHIPVSYRLPHTGLVLSFSIVDLEQDVQKLPDEDYGDGVKPDYEIEPGIGQYLKSIDAVFEFAKKHIEK